MATHKDLRAAHKAAMAAWYAAGCQTPRPPTLAERLAGAAKSPPSSSTDGEEARDTIPAPPPADLDPVERADTKRADKRLRDEHARLIDMLREERERNRFIDAIGGPLGPTPTLARTEHASGLREMAFTATLSDAHVEEEVDPVKVGGRNEYNLAIADASLRRFFDAIVSLVDHHRASGRVVIRAGTLALMGDLFSGHIHEELMETTALSPVQSVLWLRERLVAGIRFLLDELALESLAVPCSYGNHGRTTVKKRIATGAEHSFEWLLYRTLEQDFAGDPRVVFDTNPSIHQYVEVYGQTLHFTHGDSTSGGSGIAGIATPLLRAKTGWDDLRPSLLSHCGHFHQLRDLGRVIANGSVIGYNPFATYIRAQFEMPQQAFYLLDAKRGKCHFTPLWVRDDAAAAKAMRRPA